MIPSWCCFGLAFAFRRRFVKVGTNLLHIFRGKGIRNLKVFKIKGNKVLLWISVMAFRRRFVKLGTNLLSNAFIANT